jgi:hypothetical protein
MLLPQALHNRIAGDWRNPVAYIPVSLPPEGHMGRSAFRLTGLDCSHVLV